MPKLSLICPCYNESQNLLAFCDAIFSVLKAIDNGIQSKVSQTHNKCDEHLQGGHESNHILDSLESEIIFINDGSTDDTLKTLRLIQKNPAHFVSAPPPAKSEIKIIDFSRNFGKESAIYAGLQASNGDCVALIDVDLQDPPQMLIDMFAKWQSREADIIYARRMSRTGESFIRSKLSEGFYILSNLISSVRLESGVRDFRLMDRQVVDALLSMSEYHRFSKAMFEWVGFEKIGLEYEYLPRSQGRSGWSFWKLFKYGIEGFISFSTMPLRVAFVLGLVMSILSVGYGCYAIISTLIFHNAVAGWTSLVAWIAFLGGMQLIILGIIGEYIARIYEQVKLRPIYIAKKSRIKSHKNTSTK